ncbi:Coiled-coil domain-containing protein lobo [Fasciola hepatica]|uniref:Dynein regulatory complex subunit 7 n=1 Tax=Fasciola hepatica TaxID=6192 RepID=A0A4E0R8G4_FASHE|nr:Coiled-coil domain-containing protein lobo [Fasciola hepatica]
MPDSSSESSRSSSESNLANGEYEEQSAVDAEQPPNESPNSETKSQTQQESEENSSITESSDLKPDNANLLTELSPAYVPANYEKLPETFDPSLYPISYRQNTTKESRLLDYCENFRRQYATLCPDRTRPLLAPENECGVEKFVCTTLHPIYLSYPELYTWDGAASFVADFLQFVPLIPSTELPRRLLSPSTVVSIQKGTCFDYATLLCSLLLGVGYDAYVVSGYATRECCYMDETRLLSPFREKEKEIKRSEEETESKKYVIKQPKDLISQYEKACMAKELHAEAECRRLEKQQAELDDEEANKPPKDPLYGLRVHAWVLVLAGKREVPEPFFIEPLTGLSHPLDTPLYLGIEGLWNSHNYWINMQDCSTGIAHLKYDLEDGMNWEYLLPSGSLRPKAGLLDADFARSHISDTSDLTHEGLYVQSTLNFELVSQDSSQSSHVAPAPPVPLANSPGTVSARLIRPSNPADVPKLPGAKLVASLDDKLLLMDLPPSWTTPIRISQKSYELRYPGGKKVTLYRRCKVEKFAPFSEKDGVIFRLTNYSDADRTQPVDVTEKFAQRADKLLQRTTVIKTKQITEIFDHGRSGSHLAEHTFYRNQQSTQANRTMRFYHNARVDGLEKRIQTPTTMQEYYVGRKDRMYYREVLFGGKLKKFGPAQGTKDAEEGAFVCVTTTSHLTIDRITERFSRDESKGADDDLAERIFYISEDRIFLTYHIGEDRIAPCTREFIKPPNLDDRRNSIQLYSDTHSTFQVNPFAKPKTQVEIYNMLVNLMEEEELSKQAVRKSEAEVRSILLERTSEDLKVNLEVDLFDTLRNQRAHDLRLELEKAAEEERSRCKEVDLDYLAPFLAQVDIIDGHLSREQVFALREECLQDFKQRLINKANIIQARFERETEKLQKKQQWYQLNQISMSKEDEQEYLQYCNDAAFRITTLEAMLSRHKQTAPQKYMALEKRLRSDPRLNEFLHTG